MPKISFSKDLIKKFKKEAETLGISTQNPEENYEFGEEIGRGKNSIVKKCIQKSTRKEFAAKIMYWYDDTDRDGKPTCDMGELETMQKIMGWDKVASGEQTVFPHHKHVPKFYEAYFVQKYLILILDLCEGPTILGWAAEKSSYTEDHVAKAIKQLCEILEHVHSKNYAHLDLRPSNIRMLGDNLKLLDWDAARHIPNRKAGQVVDVTGDTEFCPPEMLNYDPVLPSSDMWTLAVNMYVMLSGKSPFYHEMEEDGEVVPDENKITQSVVKVQYDFKDPAFDEVSEDAKSFIKAIFYRQPEKRLTATAALGHNFLLDEKASKRKSKSIPEKIQKNIKITDERLLEEEEDEYVICSGRLAQFGMDANNSTADSSKLEEESE